MGAQTETLKFDRPKETRRAKVVIYSLSILVVTAVLLSIAARVGLLSFIHLAETNKQLLDWLLASATGTYLYLLMEAARAYSLIDNAPPEVEIPGKMVGQKKKKFELEKKAQEDAAFIASTPWYFLNCVRGPIIAIVVMLALTSVSFTSSFGARTGLLTEEPVPTEPVSAPTEEAEGSLEGLALETVVPGADGGEPGTDSAVVGVGEQLPETNEEAASGTPVTFEVDLSKASDEVLLVVAFILGMYSRVGVAALETIGSSVFQGIWKRAFPDDPESEGKAKTI